ncbi:MULTISPECIES: Smr/MutS family protein [unclassified Legionella]|uniref:Smr/MutS family protein n=1 Tax=unclassified Legionella TaxID=2622702 RepID=UPI00105611D2|nr:MULTISPECIES: Smr/MutS family protein [unclassified Legionella]MDI9819109.1 Smr/MutS family protein [Legionella sp. PL877]
MSDDFLSDEDKTLFRQTIGEIKPLHQSKKASLTLETKHFKKPETQQKAVLLENSIYLSDYYQEEVQAGTILSYCSHSIPGKRFRQLKCGQIPWQSRLDLHGLRSEEAKEALIQFILEQSALAHRCLLIIHGKGSPRGETPVLKNLVHHWLKQFPHVLAFHSALAKDGGSGALYVLLKRQRE